MIGAIAGGVSGFVLLLMTYLGHKQSRPPEPIHEIRMEGVAQDTKVLSSPGMLYPGVGLEPLRRQDYTIIGPTKGKGCATYVAFWPLPLFYVRRDGYATMLYHWDVEAIAEKSAMYNALEDLPAADALMSPRIHVDEKSVMVWYKRDCVSVSGKGLEIKVEKP